MRTLIILLYLAVNAHLVFSQEKSIPASFHSIFSAGLINGKASTSLSIQTIQGFALHRFFAGAGVGIDYYKFRSIPVFLHVRNQFGKGKRNILVYADGGYNVDWLTDKNKEPSFGNKVEYKGGLYYEIGLGYQIALKNENALLLTTGYSFKEFRRNVYFSNCITGACSTDSERYLHSMSRIAVRASFQF